MGVDIVAGSPSLPAGGSREPTITELEPIPPNRVVRTYIADRQPELSRATIYSHLATGKRIVLSLRFLP